METVLSVVKDRVDIEEFSVYLNSIPEMYFCVYILNGHLLASQVCIHPLNDEAFKILPGEKDLQNTA